MNARGQVAIGVIISAAVAAIMGISGYFVSELSKVKSSNTNQAINIARFEEKLSSIGSDVKRIDDNIATIANFISPSLRIKLK